jgi:hypothetical protein
VIVVAFDVSVIVGAGIGGGGGGAVATGGATFFPHPEETSVRANTRRSEKRFQEN